jgi:hypothetical protein
VLLRPTRLAPTRAAHQTKLPTHTAPHVNQDALVMVRPALPCRANRAVPPRPRPTPSTKPTPCHVVAHVAARAQSGPITVGRERRQLAWQLAMSSRAPAAPTTTVVRAAGTDHLWAKAAELERDFAGYKRRLAERRAHDAVAEVARAEEARGGDDAAGRGRRYEEYVRRRDERLRQEWRARMERKEAEVQALWARLDRAGSRGRRGGDGELAAATATGHAREVSSRECVQAPLSLASFLAAAVQFTWNHSIVSNHTVPFSSCISLHCCNFCSDGSSNQMTFFFHLPFHSCLATRWTKLKRYVRCSCRQVTVEY